MIGRALFAFVWLLIGAGLLLPAYRAPVPAPAVPFVARMASNVAEAKPMTSRLPSI